MVRDGKHIRFIQLKNASTLSFLLYMYFVEPLFLTFEEILYIKM